jgi:hypothetical protein
MNATDKPERIQTPRGTFRFAFESEEEAHAAGFGFWFEHDGVKIFAGGPPLPNGSNSLACAVRPKRQPK